MTADSAKVREDRRTPVVVAGMHRSGTSMVAKLLQQAGLYLGASADLMPAAEENPEGFYEHVGFVRLNDEVLNVAGAGWDCPPPSGVDWRDPAFGAFRDRAQELAAPLRAGGAWGWKDPRNSLTIPFWRSALGPLRTIFVVRNPLEVIVSLHRRNGFSVALALTLWGLYTERFLVGTSPDERLVTHFDAYFFQPEAEITRVLDFARLPSDPGSAAELRAAAVPSLRHHRQSVHDLREFGFSAAAIELYQQLCREAGWWEGGQAERESAPSVTSARQVGDATIAQGQGRVDLLRVENEALRRNNADFTARIRELEIALRGHENFRAELDGKVAERDSRLNERNALIARRDHEIAALRQQIARNDAALIDLREQVERLEDGLVKAEREEVAARLHEGDLRAMFVASQARQLERDAEIMGTLGAALSRSAPGAPASIYYRWLIGQLRGRVDALVPPGAKTLVATYGDDALLELGDRQTEPFPTAAPGVTADYTEVDEGDAIAEIEARVAAGMEYLLVPSPAQPWLASHPRLERHLDERYEAIARERGLCTIYALTRQQRQVSA
jgi:hypothetical protein